MVQGFSDNQKCFWRSLKIITERVIFVPYLWRFDIEVTYVIRDHVYSIKGERQYGRF